MSIRGCALRDPDDIPARLGELVQRIIDHPEIRGVVVIVQPDGSQSAMVEVYGFGPEVAEGAQVDRMLELARKVILDG